MADVGAAASHRVLAAPDARVQLAAISRVRWLIFKNSLRTMRGRMEMVSWIFIGLWFSALGFGGAIGIGAGTFYMVSHDRAEWLAVLFWPIFAYWIVFPLVATAFTEAFDSGNLLRYPLRYSSLVLANLIYGSIDGSTIVGILWLIGASIGAAIAAPLLAPWNILVIAVFGLSNIFLIRAVFAWIARWLAQRRTREIMGVIFFICIIGFQMIGPLSNRFRRQHFQLPGYVVDMVAAQRFLPAGLAAEAIGRALHSDWALAMGSLALLSAYAAVFLFLFHIRLRGQYAGESFGEGIPREKAPAEKVEARSTGWSLLGLPSQIAAMMEKEFRYLSRSGPMLFTLVMPAVVLFLFHMGANPNRANAIGRSPNLAFPIGAGYALLLLTNLIYNIFGVDGVGVQFYFVAPVRPGTVVAAKNLVHASVLALEMCIIAFATVVLYGRPSMDVVIATITAVVFAAPLDFAVGNLLSFYSPKKYDYSTFGRQRAPGVTVLASFGLQAVTIAIGVVAVIVSRRFGTLWIATAIFAVLAVISITIYRIALSRIDALAFEKRESLIAVLAKTS